MAPTLSFITGSAPPFISVGHLINNFYIKQSNEKNKTYKNEPTRFMDQVARDNYLIVSQIHEYLKNEQEKHTTFKKEVFEYLNQKFGEIHEKYKGFRNDELEVPTS